METATRNIYANQTAGSMNAAVDPEPTLHARLRALIERVENIAYRFDQLHVRALGVVRPPQPQENKQVRAAPHGYGQALDALENALNSLTESANALDLLA